MTIADMVSSTMVSVSPILIIQQEKECRQGGVWRSVARQGGWGGVAKRMIYN